MGFLDFFRRKRQMPANHEPPNFKVLAEKTHFSKKEIKVIYERFLSLCNYETGMLERIPFVQQPELALNPVVDLAYDMECQNFLNLRLLLKKEKEEAQQAQLEDMQKSFTERQATAREEELRHRKKRHRKRKHKKNKLENDGSLESLDGSLESLDASLDSIDESVESIDGQHVYSVDVSVNGDEESSTQQNNQLPLPFTKEKSEIDENDMDDEAYQDTVGDKEQANTSNDEVSISKDSLSKGDNESEEGTISDKNQSENNGVRDDDDKKKDDDSDEDVAKRMVCNDSDGHSSRDQSSRDVSARDDKSSDHVMVVDSSSDDGEESDQEVDKKSGEKDENSSNHEVVVDSSSSDGEESGHEVLEKSKSEERDNITEDDFRDTVVAEEVPEDKTEKDSNPMLMPMTSSFFRAQARLKQLEEEKRLAGIPPDGIDFTHFLLILNEFSPKASTSAKTSYFFKIIAANNTGCISKDEYLSYLKRLTYGLVPPFLYDEFIDDMWENVCTKLTYGEVEITRKMFSEFISTIDVNLFMTIPY